MPQIAQLSGTYASQIFWLLIFFGFTFFIIGRGMVPKVMATVSMRERQIAEDLSAAEAARLAADDVEAKWQAEATRQRGEVHAMIARAKAEAARSTEARLAEAGRAIDARLADADARIAAARDSAMGEIEAVATDAAGDIVARLAGITIDAGAARTVVKEMLHG